MKFIDFFSGIGGFRRGMELAGHECVGFCEFDKFAVASYTAMHLMTEQEREYISTLPKNKRVAEAGKEEYRHGEWYANDIRRIFAEDMPKAAARIWLKVTDVRVERLQDITFDSCKNEGIYDDYKTYSEAYANNLRRVAYPKAFARLWDSTIEKSDIDRYGWNANPWVWVIEFERCEKPKEE